MILTHKIALDPTHAQAVYFAKASGVARFAWNWGLAEWQRQYRSGCEQPSWAKLSRQLNAIKREQFPWMLEVTKAAPSHALMNLGAAFRRFFSKKAKYPRFKKKGVHDSFRAENGKDTFSIDGRRITLPRVGTVRMREPLRFAGRAVSVTISRVADRWFASVAVEIDHVAPVRENQAIGGVDLGVAALATFSNGTVIRGPMALRANLGRYRRLSRALSRKRPGSANRRKAVQRIARLHARIASIRADALHKLTTNVVRQYGTVGIEDLHVRWLCANRRLARAVADLGLSEFRRQLEYKAALHGTRLVVVDRWFPSSKRCADCGAVLADLPLSVREWACPCCGVVHDRDVNAARNLAFVAAGLAASACGGEGSGRSLCRNDETSSDEPGTSTRGKQRWGTRSTVTTCVNESRSIS